MDASNATYRQALISAAQSVEEHGSRSSRALAQRAPRLVSHDRTSAASAAREFNSTQARAAADFDKAPR